MRIFLFLGLCVFLFTINCQAQLGTVKVEQKISATSGNFTGQINTTDQFGRNVVNIGDLDGDGVEDLAVGANLDDDGGNNKGAIWILFLNTNGTVKSHQKISVGTGGFTGIPHSVFGTSVGLIGDLNGDGVQDIVVGETDSNDGASQAGAVWILFMNTNGTVQSHQKISSIFGNFNTALQTNGRFGTDVAGMGDLDNDGVLDIAVSQHFANVGGTQNGTVWILFLNTDGTVKASQSINANSGGFTGTLENYDNFGSGIANLGDFDNDGVNDLLVGARGDDDGGTDKGAVWGLLLNSNGTVKSHFKISATTSGFTNQLSNEDRFGIAVEKIDDLDSDGVTDIVVGAYLDDDGAYNAGAIWILFLNANGTVKNHQKISSTAGNFTGQLNNEDIFGGWGISMLNDLNNDGMRDLAVCALGTDDGGFNNGAVWILFLDEKVTNSTSIAPFQMPNLNLYPNPSHGQFTLDGFTKTNFNIRIYNVQGQLVQDFRIDEPIQQLEIFIETKGVYFLEYTDDDNLRVVKKFVVLD